MLYRRHFLASPALALAPARTPAASAGPANGPALHLLQCMDTSSDQQEHVRDYAAGVQLAVQAANRSGGAGGRRVQVEALACDGSPAAMAALQERLSADSGLLGLVGTTSERLSLAIIAAQPAGGTPWPHIAPWLPDARHDALEPVVNLFASREEQLRYTLDSLHAMGLRQFGVVYDGPRTRQTVQTDLDATLHRLHLAPPSWTATAAGGVEALVQALPAAAPPVLTFAGGTLELARFVQALSRRELNRLVVNLSGADLGLLSQLGATRAQPLVLTQVVPNPLTHQAPYARQFREQHAQLYDETPTPSGLAGYIAGRYTLRLLERVAAAPSRAALLDEVRRRVDDDIDGYALRFGPARRRGSRYVTLIMVGRDGRMIG
jgi:ABC-type branched-subunit amino acid transport system substrate-binding protein